MVFQVLRIAGILCWLGALGLLWIDLFWFIRR